MTRAPVALLLSERLFINKELVIVVIVPSLHIAEPKAPQYTPSPEDKTLLLAKLPIILVIVPALYIAPPFTSPLVDLA